MLVYTVLAISGLYLFFDVSYFLRGAYTWLRWRVATSNGNVCEDLLKDSVVDSKYRLHPLSLARILLIECQASAISFNVIFGIVYILFRHALCA